MGSHATGMGSEQPTPAQLKELFAQIEAGRVTKSRMQEFLRGPKQSVSVRDARIILGRNYFFGPDEWKIYLGDDFPDITVPQIPWSESELVRPMIHPEHFLFLGLERFPSGRPVNLITWYSLSDLKEAHVKFRDYWFLGESFSQTACKLRWYFMPIGEVQLVNGLSYKDSAETLSLLGYEVPNTIERVTANNLFYILNSSYLDDDFVQTSDKLKRDRRVRVYGDPECGIVLDTVIDTTDTPYPISASRKM